MTAPSFTLAEIDRLVNGRVGVIDIPCPLCGPHCKTPGNRVRLTLRVWREQLSFASYYCARCEAAGYAFDGHAAQPDPAALERMRKQAEAHRHETALQSQAKAAWLWKQRLPLAGSVGEIYLREARGYCGPLPRTLGFLPPFNNYPPALIAALGLTLDDVQAVHITSLKMDGSGKAGTDSDKKIVGQGVMAPIVLAPVTGPRPRHRRGNQGCDVVTCGNRDRRLGGACAWSLTAA
jgi:hypothetical protein